MKYQELREQLIELIDSGEGCDRCGRFLSERGISERYHVSRTTVRRAIADLQKQGYLISIHGKGTFVKGRDRSQSIYSIIRCSENYAEIGLHPSNQILEQKIVPATENVAFHLKVEVGEPVLYLDKLYRGDRTIFNETLSYLPLKRFPGIEHADFSRAPILEIMRSMFAAEPKRTENTIEAVLPPLEIADNLKITKTTPLVLFESVTLGSLRGMYVPMEYFKCYYRTDTLRFSFSQDHDAVR